MPEQLGTYSFTSRILNYVEPYYIDGVAKTSFYTEVNTNILTNDKIFITNGVYDSEVNYISRGKYVQNADGYTVLYVNNCQIVIDLNYNGSTQSYLTDNFDNYIKIYHIQSQREFDYINKLHVDTYPNRISKFEFGYTNNIIYTDDAYSMSNDILGNNTGISSSGFWARSGINWVNVNAQFSNNSFTFSSDYYAIGLANNGRITIIGEDFSFNYSDYKQRNIYKFTSSWTIDTSYKPPIISKLYFREGVFMGKHNDGLFGSYVGPEQNWYGTQSTWNSGMFINSNWCGGLMGSKSKTTTPSYYASLVNGIPVQTTDYSNNKGNGYNYILDSNIYGGVIENGNFINCNIGPTSVGFTAIDGYFGGDNNFSLLTEGGLYNYCDVSNSEITNSTTLDTIIKNSYLENTSVLNSQLSESYLNGGQFSINNGINVISADIISYIPNYIGTATSSDIRGVLKLYISDDDYNRLDIFDNFYITQINKNYILSSLSTDQQVILPYETRYVLDTFFYFNQSCVASIKGKSENNFNIIVYYDDILKIYGNTSSTTQHIYSSIDIDLGQYLAFYKNLSNNTYTYLNQNIITKNNVQTLFLNTSITNSDVRDGVVEGITWTSGSNVNYPSNIIGVQDNKLQIVKYSSSEIEVTLNESQPTINDGQLSINTYVWLDSIYHTDNIGNVTNISGAYKITNINQDTNKVLPVVIRLSSSIINSIPIDGIYSVPGSLPLYVSINKLLIDNSTINSGLFVRSLITNSTFINEKFNNQDTGLSLSNLNLLRMVNLLFDNNDNTVISGVVHKSHVLNINWISGIINNSIWIGPSFSNGVFNNGYWETGSFNNGYFQNSLGIGLTSVDYSNELHYNNWVNGTFNNGYFNNSIWLNGVFNNGKLYNSNWYSGVWNYGVLGDKNIPTLNTLMGVINTDNITISGTQTIWNDGIVENAQIGGDGIVYWYGGNFNNGIFTSNGKDYTNESIWYGGNFNGGSFKNLSRWKNGIFNGGRFASIYGYTSSSSTYSCDYSWENGIFKGGQFGLGTYGTNSTWFNGEFDNGIFQGMVWNNGVFQGGNFNGGSQYSVVSDEELFVESFTQSYYGLWRNGWVVDVKHKAIKDQLIPTNNLRKNQTQIKNSAFLQNILWLNGTFDHPNGTVENSAWLNGTFSNGVFTNGVFNPFANRSYWDNSYPSYPAFNLSLYECLWLNGTFDGLFYISDWHDGVFTSGTMSGGRWMNGTWEYGYAKNIYWDNGTWKNGIWEGDPFDYNNLTSTSITNNDMIYSKDRDIILRVSNILNNGLIHITNAFTGTYSSQLFGGWMVTNTLTPNWMITGGSAQLFGLNNIPPRLDIYSESFTYPNASYELIVGYSVNQGDSFIITIGNGSIIYTAVSGDTQASVATNLVLLINQGLYINIVQFQEYSQYGNLITTYATWRKLGNINLTCISSGPGIFMVNVSLNNSYVYLIVNTIAGGIVSNYTQSDMLYGLSLGLTTSIFTDNTTYNISLNVSSFSGRTDFMVYIGNSSYTESISSSTDVYNYSYTPSLIDPTNNFIIQRIAYPNPDNSTFVVNSVNITEIVSVYSEEFNNNLYQFATFSIPYSYGPTGASVSLPTNLNLSTISNNGIVSLKFGNGVFKSGIWNGGIWNNGWRSTWDGSSDITYFSNVSTVLKISSTVWNITLNVSPLNDLSLLNIGDKIGIGNLVFIDINENRKLSRDYYMIVNMTSITITVQISTNTLVRRIVQDSMNHLIYVTKNIWMSGIFLNGYFKGVWNYGLFKGYPYVTHMEDSIWIDGVFDGGRFTSTQSYYVGITQSYNTGLVQNFTFLDNNILTPNTFNYNSWIDVNYFTQSMTNLSRGNNRYNIQNNLISPDGNLKGYPTVDILSSDSVFRNSYDTKSQSYKLGYAYKKYVDYIGNSSYFTYPVNTNGAPGVSEFLQNGWTYSNNSAQYYSNTFGNDTNELVVSYYTQNIVNVGIKAVQTAAVSYYCPGDSSFSNDFNHYSGYSFTYSLIGSPDVSLTGLRFSNLGYTASSWVFEDNTPFSYIVSANLAKYPATFMSYPIGVPINAFNSNQQGSTNIASRRVYMMDWFRLDSTDSIYNGYNNTGTYSNGYYLYSTNTEYGSMTFSAYTVPNTTTLTINAFVPFQWSGNEGANAQGGWSGFKFIGTVEKCSVGLTTSSESNWQVVATTNLQYNTTILNNNIGLDLNKCAIVWDGNMRNTVIGNLNISGFNINVNAGDRIRFRLYFVNTAKIFATSGEEAPGQFYFKIGTDTHANTILNYSQNNHGYFEIYDPKTYVNPNTNIIDNTLTYDIPGLRYSMVDFVLDNIDPSSTEPFVTTGTQSPYIYLLTNNPGPSTPNSPVVINHASIGEQTEYFYNRTSLQLFFESTYQFTAWFSRISFYETDMIPFFMYATESDINQSIQTPYYGINCSGVSFADTISVNGILYQLISNQSKY